MGVRENIGQILGNLKNFLFRRNQKKLVEPEEVFDPEKLDLQTVANLRNGGELYLKDCLRVQDPAYEAISINPKDAGQSHLIQGKLLATTLGEERFKDVSFEIPRGMSAEYMQASTILQTLLNEKDFDGLQSGIVNHLGRVKMLGNIEQSTEEVENFVAENLVPESFTQDDLDHEEDRDITGFGKQEVTPLEVSNSVDTKTDAEKTDEEITM